MEEKLKSILRAIPWYLALKSAVFAAAWVALPEWMAWVLALVFYFSSFFRAKHMGVPFLALLIIGHLLGQNLVVAVALGFIFFLILGSKELIFIDRRGAMRAIIYSILFLGSIAFYSDLDGWAASMPLKAFLFAWLFWALSRRFIAKLEAPDEKHPLILAGSAFLLWEISAVVAFLPLDFLYQAAIVMVSIAALFEWTVAGSEGTLTRNKALLYSSFLFIFVTILFTSAKWSL